MLLRSRWNHAVLLAGGAAFSLASPVSAQPARDPAVAEQLFEQGKEA